MIIAVLTAALAGLQPGATVRLPPGDHALVAIEGRSFDPPVTIDAAGATVHGLRMIDSKGVIWRGGTIMAPGGRNGAGANFYGVDLRRSTGLTLDGVTFTNALRGIVAADSRGLTVRNSRFAGLRSDGINLAGTSGVIIEHNSFSDFTPVKATGSKADGSFIDGDHPDAVQIWSTKTNPASADIGIRDNNIDGDTQGINTFGPRLQGYRNFVVENNRVRVNYPSAIAVMGCSDCRVRFNTVSSVPGSRYRANIRTTSSTGAFCGNIMKDVPRHPAAAKC